MIWSMRQTGKAGRRGNKLSEASLNEVFTY